ncbi:MAG: hypothetical protein K2K80_04085 [Clostridia bacterium]|nr:hypothetical protein [Clostridia bacterium]
MKSAIDELILKNSTFMENVTLNETYWQLINNCNEIYCKLKETLNEKQVELLDKLIYNHEGLEAEASELNLLHGFKAGIRLMIECL